MYLYPIKSTYGIEVQSAEVGQYGFKYDREWMLIDESNNFISQRVYPKVRRIFKYCPLLFRADQSILGPFSYHYK